MSDNVSKRKRSEVMSKVRSRGNERTEVVLLRILRAYRIVGWRRHANLPGTPDFSFREHRVAVFVDGCFWHACPKHRVTPIQNRAFWIRKFTRNVSRDKATNRSLRRAGWRVIRIWEHELRFPERVAARIQRALITQEPR
jgi:DNA mismatch endonuclease (patch repair protein)